MRTLTSAIVLLATVGTSHADQITLGESTTGDYQFTQATVPPGDIVVSVPSLISGPAYFQNDTGTYTLGPLFSTAAGPLTNGLFPTLFPQELTITMSDGDTFTTAADIKIVKDDSLEPDLIGTVTTPSFVGADLSGDQDWLNSFPPNTTALFDLSLFGANVTLSQIVDYGGEADEQVSSGEVIPQPSSVPEPSTSLLYMIIALLATLVIGKARIV